MNEILFFGSNQLRKLIKNEPDKITKPIQFKFENENENENEKQIKQISSGYFGTIFLFKNGKAIEYLKENDSNPEEIQIEENIQKVTVDTNDRIIQDIVSGLSSIYLLTSNQNAYGIGSNNYGQLGFDPETLEKTEKPILMMKNISKIFSGNDSFSVFLLNSNQELFGCGYNYDGQLGLGRSTQIHKLTQIQNIPKGKIIDIQCGFFHSLMLIENENENENPKRKLYSCGYYEYNGLGKIHNTYEFTEIKSSLFENDDILDFSCGCVHTLILTSKGKLFIFGGNSYGQLGTGDRKYQKVPIQIELPKLRFNENIYNYHVLCGYSNSFIYYSPPSFSNLEEDLIKLFKRKEFCDISFKTKNGEIIEVHKLILKYRLNQNQNQNQIEKLKEIISTKSIKESNQIFKMIYSNNSKINPKLYSEIKEIINSNEKIEETMKRIYLNENENENEKDFIIERKEKQYKFPKLILIMRSELYRGMFLSVTEDKSNKVTDYSELSISKLSEASDSKECIVVVVDYADNIQEFRHQWTTEEYHKAKFWSLLCFSILYGEQILYYDVISVETEKNGFLVQPSIDIFSKFFTQKIKEGKLSKKQNNWTSILTVVDISKIKMLEKFVILNILKLFGSVFSCLISRNSFRISTLAKLFGIKNRYLK
ncbi:claret isoform a [Anaeramoeba ignava]|uniref:Claret isoform a n=1 Tax=Anaeramoeba ignava TaxID=1746090 RepID=A0A9Q0R8X8_ANAIG|nr:claret isoform a [Anaeramoeba ignava]